MKRTALALAALAGTFAISATASAQDTKVTSDQAAAMVRFALPTMLDGVYTKCGATLPRDGFLMTNRSQLTAKFTDGAAASWSRAKGGIAALAGDSAKDMFGAMPDSALQPFLLAMVGQGVAEKMKVEDCSTLDALMAELAPLPADNFANIVGIVVSAEMNKDS